MNLLLDHFISCFLFFFCASPWSRCLFYHNGDRLENMASRCRQQIHTSSTHAHTQIVGKGTFALHRWDTARKNGAATWKRIWLWKSYFENEMKCFQLLWIVDTKVYPVATANSTMRHESCANWKNHSLFLIINSRNECKSWLCENAPHLSFPSSLFFFSLFCLQESQTRQK